VNKIADPYNVNGDPDDELEKGTDDVPGSEIPSFTGKDVMKNLLSQNLSSKFSSRPEDSINFYSKSYRFTKDPSPAKSTHVQEIEDHSREGSSHNYPKTTRT
jgi:hypothetical protein